MGLGATDNGIVKHGGGSALRPIPLVTSIPPRFSRKDDAGVDIGPGYLLRCVESWRKSNFEPISINAQSEEIYPLAGELGVRCVHVSRDARELCGKPLAYLTDLIAAACTLADGPVAITNSDILLDVPDDVCETIAAIRPGQCLVAKRVDIESVDARAGSEYRYGYDFFVYHTHDLRSFAEGDFVFGAPFWDHFLPITMFLRGVKQISGSKGFAYHLVHSERWDWQLWSKLGQQYVSLICGRADQEAAPLVRRLKQAAGGYDQPLRAMLKIRAKRLTAAGRKLDDIEALHRVSRVNESWIDGMIGSEGSNA
jgi:hypothetical protein